MESNVDGIKISIVLDTSLIPNSIEMKNVWCIQMESSLLIQWRNCDLESRYWVETLNTGIERDI